MKLELLLRSCMVCYIKKGLLLDEVIIAVTLHVKSRVLEGA